jgi:hypothetical protein
MAASAALLLFGRITLGLVFASSGVSKLANMDGFRTALETFGLPPARVTNLIARIIVLAELAVAAALLVGVAVEGALIAVLVLLTVFTVALARSLVQGRRVVCRCFGELSTRPASWGAVLRNILLLASGVTALLGSQSAVSDTLLLTTADVVVVGMLSLSALALAALLGEAGSLVRGQSPLGQQGQ